MSYNSSIIFPNPCGKELLTLTHCLMGLKTKGKEIGEEKVSKKLDLSWSSQNIKIKFM